MNTYNSKWPFQDLGTAATIVLQYTQTLPFCVMVVRLPVVSTQEMIYFSPFRTCNRAEGSSVSVCTQKG